VHRAYGMMAARVLSEEVGKQSTEKNIDKKGFSKKSGLKYQTGGRDRAEGINKPCARCGWWGGVKKGDQKKAAALK